LCAVVRVRWCVCRRNVNVCFIGSCGTGKSTLAGHLQLLVLPLSGRVCVCVCAVCVPCVPCVSCVACVCRVWVRSGANEEVGGWWWWSRSWGRRSSRTSTTQPRPPRPWATSVPMPRSPSSPPGARPIGTCRGPTSAQTRAQG
jgi:energy-coupling factor transporter ATP-binding protein EcfA2